MLMSESHCPLRASRMRPVPQRAGYRPPAEPPSGVQDTNTPDGGCPAAVLPAAPRNSPRPQEAGPKHEAEPWARRRKGGAAPGPRPRPHGRGGVRTGRRHRGRPVGAAAPPRPEVCGLPPPSQWWPGRVAGGRPRGAPQQVRRSGGAGLGPHPAAESRLPAPTRPRAHQPASQVRGSPDRMRLPARLENPKSTPGCTLQRPLCLPQTPHARPPRGSCGVVPGLRRRGPAWEPPPEERA